MSQFDESGFLLKERALIFLRLRNSQSYTLRFREHPLGLGTVFPAADIVGWF